MELIRFIQCPFCPAAVRIRPGDPAEAFSSVQLSTSPGAGTLIPMQVKERSIPQNMDMDVLWLYSGLLGIHVIYYPYTLGLLHWVANDCERIGRICVTPLISIHKKTHQSATLGHITCGMPPKSKYIVG